MGGLRSQDINRPAKSWQEFCLLRLGIPSPVSAEWMNVSLTLNAQWEGRHTLLCRWWCVSTQEAIQGSFRKEDGLWEEQHHWEREALRPEARYPKLVKRCCPGGNNTGQGVLSCILIFFSYSYYGIHTHRYRPEPGFPKEQ